MELHLGEGPAALWCKWTDVDRGCPRARLTVVCRLCGSARRCGPRRKGATEHRSDGSHPEECLVPRQDCTPDTATGTTGKDKGRMSRDLQCPSGIRGLAQTPLPD